MPGRGALDEAVVVMRVAIADDSESFRRALSSLVTALGMDVCVEARTADELLASLAGCPADLVIVDVRMPPTHTDEGVRAALEVKRRMPRTGVLVVTADAVTQQATALFAAGQLGVGFLTKRRITDAALLSESLRRLGEGEVVADHDVVDDLMARTAARCALDGCSERERSLVALLAEGRSDDNIAASLGEPRSLRADIRSVLSRLRVDGAASRSAPHRTLAVLALLAAD